MKTKNLIKIWMLSAAAVSMALTGCSSESSSSADSGSEQTVSYASALEYIDAAWNADTDENKPSVVGGSLMDVQSDSPAVLNLEQAETLETVYQVPLDVIEKAQSGAGMVNAMMANYFTASVWQFSSADEAKSLADTVMERVQSTQWMCGMPETAQIAQAGEFLIVCYGLNDQVEPFMEACASLQGGYTLLRKENLE